MSNNTGAGMTQFYSVIGAILMSALALAVAAVAIALVVDRVNAILKWYYEKAYGQCRKALAMSLNTYAWHFSDNEDTVLAFRIMAQHILTDRSLEDSAKVWEQARKDPDHKKTYLGG